MIAATAAIWVPPASITGTVSEAAEAIPATTACMGSPTAATAASGSAASEPLVMPAAASPWATVAALRPCAPPIMVDDTLPSASRPSASITASAVVVPAGTDSPRIR